MTINRRTFLRLASLGVVGGIFSDAFAVEVVWIDETHLNLSKLGLGKKIVHFSDLHYNRSDGRFVENVVNKINDKKPDYVVFTGDLVNNRAREHLSEALEYIREIKAPAFGVPGNHDPSDITSRRAFKVTFESTGGGFLVNERVELRDFIVHGVDGVHWLPEKENKKKILLCHYPGIGDLRIDQPYDLVLSGHSHGGQIRLPFLGAPIVPAHVGRYVKGLYESKIGTLYVSTGVGTSLVPVRFLCRPEITEILI